MTLNLTFFESFLIDFLETRSVQEWNDWMRRLFDRNLICSAWRAHDEFPPMSLHFDFRSADLPNLNLDGLDMTQCDLTGANFTHTSLRGARFRWCPAAVFNGSDLRDAQFVCGDISAVNFTDARMEKRVLFDEVSPTILRYPPHGLCLTTYCNAA